MKVLALLIALLSEPPRVQAARAASSTRIEQLFQQAAIAYPPRRVLLRAFKQERELELWAGADAGEMKRITTYAICASSGEPGEKTRAVVQAFARQAANEFPLSPERFKTIMNEVKTETDTKGKDLFHPVRIMLIGSHSGPEFDKLIPLLEEGSTLDLPVHVKSVRERVAEFMAAQELRS